MKNFNSPRNLVHMVRAEIRDGASMAALTLLPLTVEDHGMAVKRKFLDRLYREHHMSIFDLRNRERKAGVTDTELLDARRRIGTANFLINAYIENHGIDKD